MSDIQVIHVCGAHTQAEGLRELAELLEEHGDPNLLFLAIDSVDEDELEDGEGPVCFMAYVGEGEE